MLFYCDLLICSGWLVVTAVVTFLNSFMCWSRFGNNSIRKASQLTTSTFMSINFLYGTFVLALYCTPICLVESSCWSKSPSSSSDLRTLSISIFSFCLTFPSTSIILVRGPLVYPLISGNIRQPKMEPSLRQYTQNRVCYVVYRAIRSSRNNPNMNHLLMSEIFSTNCVELNSSLKCGRIETSWWPYESLWSSQIMLYIVSRNCIIWMISRTMFLRKRKLGPVMIMTMSERLAVTSKKG